MRKIMLAAPCLLLSSLVVAKEPANTNAPANGSASSKAAAPTDTSKRFHMTQDGKRMTADDFDAWMKKNGYRVATGAPAKSKEDEPVKQGSK